MINDIFKIWRYIVEFLSSEWILTRFKIPNGGPVIALRSLISSIILFLLIIAFLNIVDPTKSWQFSFLELKTQIIERFTLFGVIFAGMYTALYARFSSQWTYLANLYNKIKEIEASSPTTLNNNALAEWKAGFIEDADNLHIGCKGTFVTIIKVWGENEAVKDAFIENSPGGEERYNELMARVYESIRIVEKKFNRPNKSLSGLSSNRILIKSKNRPSNKATCC